MAVDYRCHALELSQRSEAELAARFNMELSCDARFEPKRSQAVGQLLAMHKRHGETNFAVLKEVLSEQAEPLLQGKVEEFLAGFGVLGRPHRQQRQLGREMS